jgi:hypothetical protein
MELTVAHSSKKKLILVHCNLKGPKVASRMN